MAELGISGLRNTAMGRILNLESTLVQLGICFQTRPLFFGYTKGLLVYAYPF